MSHGSNERTAPHQASRGEIRELARVLALAYFDDPVHCWAYPQPRQRRRFAPGDFAAMLRRRIRDGMVTTTTDQKSVAVWTPPGCFRFTRWDRISGALRARWVHGSRSDLLARGYREIFSRHPSPPYWYLLALGTHPESRRRGLAGSLLHPVFRGCDRAGIRAYLESSTENNIPYYERFGFKLVDEIELPEGPRVWPMMREPR